MAPDGLAERLRRAAADYPDRPALVLKREELRYADFFRRAEALATSLAAGEGEFVGVLAERGVGAYVAIIAAVLAGKAWVPLNPKFPHDRLGRIVAASDLKQIVHSAAHRSLAADLAGETIAIIADDRASANTIEHRAAAAPDRIAYLMFTSGSTGEPKGVPVTEANLLAYLDTVVARYGYGPNDRHSQTFELSFDLSVHDIFCALTTGGALVPIVESELLRPSIAIADRGITAWFCVPSLANFMRRSRALSPSTFPGLRVSLFCGEALPADLMAAWQEAAPQSIVENLYGPTEATIAITAYRAVDKEAGKAVRLGLAPIGRPFPGQSIALFDADAATIANGPGCGELLLGGTQLTTGYWRNDEQTADRFFFDAGSRWYRTGDLVEQDDDGVLHFLGRVDNQVKFRGYRIELSEIEHALRQIAGTDEAVALIAHPPEQDIIIAAVLISPSIAVEDILVELRRRLPGYMIPAQIEVWDDFPKNLSGKVDRKAIAARFA